MTDTNIWVGGLPDHTDDTTFRALFEEHGTIISSRVFSEKWYGFVQFATAEQAALVVATLNGAEFGGRLLQIRYAQKKGEGKGKGSGGKAGSWEQSHQSWRGNSKGKASQWVPEFPNAQNSRYSPYGGADAYGGRDADAEFQNAQSNYAYVGGDAYSGGDMDINAMKELAQLGTGDFGGGDPPEQEPGGQEFSGEEMPNAIEVARVAHGAPPVDGISGARCASQEHILVGRHSEFLRGDSDSNLYITGLPPNADQLYLYKLFSPFGSTLTTYAKQTAMGMIGFVTFATNHDANVAMSILNGQMTVEGTQLQISVQIKKGARKQSNWNY